MKSEGWRPLCRQPYLLIISYLPLNVRQFSLGLDVPAQMGYARKRNLCGAAPPFLGAF
uniref:Uncharacterized protein n=1 Tax=uncultured bacterium contig00097 TaxID=1181566 RepID=A0A806K1D1_9BACT|nr:hypothetical protein [uncultured bacterium contig00097]